MSTSKTTLLSALLASAFILTGCAEPEPSAFVLRFAATADGKEIGCTDKLTGFGPEGKHSIGLSDLRFYVSNIRFSDADGQPVTFTLDRNEFQYTSAAGSVALVDLTGNTEGTCGDSAVAFAEGTARTNTGIKGTTVVEHVASVSFDIGVPQAVMKETIADNTLEGAPTPLNEMYWSWATGYRHFVMNFTVDDGGGHTGDGYVHIGSRNCGPADGLALEDRTSCEFVNTPAVSLPTFDLATDTVRVELPAVLQGLDFISPIYDMTTFEVIGEGPGVECHSSPMQPDCPPVFSRFGLNMATGRADAKTNQLFSRK
ncbi:MAG: metallo-mystery pair system four-Cys motif protein [Minicystis sp.]